MQYVGFLLVVIHLFLLGWSLGGLLELFLPKVPWTPFTNPDFPQSWLPVHWGSVWIAAVGFLYVYFTAWPKTPHFMLVAYGLLALVRAIETFGFLTNKTEYLFMILEYIAYAGMLYLLFKNSYFQDIFKHSN